ncbi:MAG: cation diffusion facilitator family transporter [Candidatus Omnitrophota bacterium]
MTVEPGHHHHHRITKLSRLRVALLLTASGMLIEFIGGFLANSLALISDAWHMVTHLFALSTSYFAITLAMRPATKKRTYGFYRAEILAAFVNGIVLIFISGYLVYEAIQRFMHPESIKVQEMLLVAFMGLVINGVSTILLARISSHDLNIKSAFLHEIGDMISSVAVVVAGIVIFYTKNYIVDPLLAVFICILIIIWAIKLIIDSSNILLEATPKHLDIDEVIAVLKNEIKGIYEVHHVHAWTIASGMYSLTAHIVIDDCHVSRANELLGKINELVKERFHIEHTNIQFECLVKKS